MLETHENVEEAQRRGLSVQCLKSLGLPGGSSSSKVPHWPTQGIPPAQQQGALPESQQGKRQGGSKLIQLGRCNSARKHHWRVGSCSSFFVLRRVLQPTGDCAVCKIICASPPSCYLGDFRKWQDGFIDLQ